MIRDTATINCIIPLFTNIISWLFALAGTVGLFLIIFSGIKFVTSGGDPKQVEGARKTLTYAIIGLMVIFFSYLIINLISSFTGVGCIKVFGLDSCQKRPVSQPTSIPRPTGMF